MRVLLDSSTLINSLRQEKDALEVFSKIMAGHIEGVVNGTIVFEIYAGVPRQQNPEKAEKKVDAMMSLLRYGELAKKDFRDAGLLDGQLIRAGLQINEADTIIAIHAARPEIDILITENVDHYRRIEKIRAKVKTAAEWLKEN